MYIIEWHAKWNS